jgi:hypothetical protein
MYLSWEEDDDESRRRFEAIGRHYQCSREQMKQNGLHVFDFVGKDAVLGEPDRNDHIRPTPLCQQIEREAVLIRPKLS